MNLLLAAMAASMISSPLVPDAGDNRMESPLIISMRRIGTIRPRSVAQIDGSNWTIGCETLDRDFANFEEYKTFLAPLGIKTIRLQAGWAKCEKEKGTYDFSWLDHIIDYACGQGLNVLLETDYGNPIYEGGGLRDVAGRFPAPGPALAAWDAWIDAMSRHFAGRVRDWAMWNEPDYRPRDGSAPKTPAEIADFNIRTAKIIRRNIPDARIAGLSLAYSNPEYLEACLKAMGEDVKLFRWIIYHGYAEAPESSYAVVEEQKKVLAKYNPAAKMRQGENGCPSEMSRLFALRYIPWSEYSQAKWDMRRMLGDPGHDVESSVFTICDFHHKGREINQKGLLRANEERQVVAVKRAYYAVQNVVAVFDNTLERVVDSSFRSADGTLSTYEYRKADGRRVFAFWTHAAEMVCTNGMKGVVGKEKYVAEYLRPGDFFATRPAVFQYSGAPLHDPVWVDLFTGHVYEFPGKDMLVHSCGVTFINVPVYDSPCLLTEKSVALP